MKAAVIGAGPAGLAAASFLAREGFEVHVHEREREPGGVIRHTVPAFRVPVEAIAKDVSLLEDLGVRFHFGSAATVESLRADGARYVLAAIGAERDRGIGIEGARGALEFLHAFRAEPRRLRPGRSVVVVGAGDTAMDAARAARRCRGVREVRVVYRRSEREMPASREEYEDARAEGVTFRFLASPERWNGRVLTCRVMRLGEPGSDGRARPEPTDATFDVPADTVIAATGSDVDAAAKAALEAAGAIAIGDAATGPSTIVKAIASATEGREDHRRAGRRPPVDRPRAGLRRPRRPARAAQVPRPPAAGVDLRARRQGGRCGGGGQSVRPAVPPAGHRTRRFGPSSRHAASDATRSV